MTNNDPWKCEVCGRAPPAVAFPVVEDDEAPGEWRCRDCSELEDPP